MHSSNKNTVQECTRKSSALQKQGEKKRVLQLLTKFKGTQKGWIAVSIMSTDASSKYTHLYAKLLHRTMDFMSSARKIKRWSNFDYEKCDLSKANGSSVGPDNG